MKMKSVVVTAVLLALAVHSGCRIPQSRPQAELRQDKEVVLSEARTKGWILASQLLLLAEAAPHVDMSSVKHGHPSLGGPPAVIARSGKWSYLMAIPNRSVTSTTLQYDGLPIRPDKVGQIIDTPFGKMQFLDRKGRPKSVGWFLVAASEQKDVQ